MRANLDIQGDTPSDIKTGSADSGDQSPLAAARQKLREQHASGQKTVRRTPIEKSRAKPGSLRLAINAMCWQCQGEDADPCVEWRIGNCKIDGCALHPQRPYQRLQGKPTPKSLVSGGEEKGR